MIIPFLLLLEGFLPGRALYGSDVVLQFHAWRHYGFETLKNGTLPLWNPYIFCGVPYIAGMQSAMFYPLNLIFLFLPTEQAIDVSLALHLAVAAALMYVWMRRLGLGPPASFTASAVFAFSGFPMTHLYAGHLPQLNSWAWLPGAFLATDLLVTKRSRLSAIPLGLVLALQITAGHPQIVFLTLLAVLPYAIVRAWKSVTAESRARILGGVAVMGLLSLAIGLGLAAAQVLPSLEFLPYSSRPGKGSFGFATMASFPPENLITFLMPGFFGRYDFVPYLDPLVKHDLLKHAYWGRWIYWELCPFVGVIPLLMAIHAVITRRKENTVFFALLAAVSVLLALGRYNPLYTVLLDAVPGLSGFRTPGRFLCLNALALAVLSGFGCETLLGDSQSGKTRAVKRIAIGTLAGAIIACIGFALTGSSGQHWPRFVSWAMKHGERWGYLPVVSDQAFLSRTLAGAQESCELLAGMLAVCSALFFLASGVSRRRIMILCVAAPALVLLELWDFGRGYVHTVYGSQFQWEKGLVASLRASPGPVRVLTFTDTASLDRGMLYGIANAAGNDSAMLASYNKLANLMQGKSADAPLTIVRFKRVPEPLSDFLGVTHSVFPAARHKCLPGFEPAYRGEAMNLCSREKPPVRAFVAHEWKYVPDEDSALAAVASGQFDLSRIVLIAEPAPSEWVVKPSGAISTAQVIQCSPGRMTINAQMKERGFLVLREAAYPGWRATSAGRKLRLYRADGIFHAVALEPGIHRVEFSYRPLSFRIGALLSLATCAACLTAAGHQLRLRLHRS